MTAKRLCPGSASSTGRSEGLQHENGTIPARRYISLGAGLEQPTCRRVAIDGVSDMVCTLVEHAGHEAWWAPGVFSPSYRTNGNWRGASSVPVDVDCHRIGGEKAEKAAPTREATAHVEALAVAGRLPGSFSHATPHGFRIVFVLSSTVTEASVYKRIAQAALALVGGAFGSQLGRHGDLELELDTCTLDLARLMFTPCSTVDGEVRRGEVRVLREQPYAVEELAAAVPAEQPARTKVTTERELTKPRSNGRPSVRTFEEAVVQWNSDQTPDWSPHDRTCPMCGHHDCFGPLPEQPSKWFCFSTRHGADSGGAGRLATTSTGYWGDALDQEAHRRGKSRREVLVEDGYLAALEDRDEADEGDERGESSRDQRPVIRISTNIARDVQQAETALLKLDAGVYQRGSRPMLVHIVRDGARALPRLTRAPSSPVIDPLQKATLRERMAGAARWKKGKKSILPPQHVVEALITRGEWTFPPLEALVEAPTMLLDGAILDRPGYDSSSGLLLDFGNMTFPPIVDRPTRDHASQAFAVLSEPLCDFPFVNAFDKAAAVGAMITIVARTAIDGPTPFFFIRAPAPASGKGLLAGVIALPGTGRSPAVLVPPEDPDEWRKLGLALAIQGTPLVLIDNVCGLFGSPALAALLTAPDVEGRVLGVSQTARAPLRTVWLATGNNVTFRGDLARRVVPIDLDPRLEHPEDRHGFRYEPLLAHIRHERGRLVAAALTLLRAYHVAGRPGHGQPVVGSFEAWDLLVRGAIIWAADVDPCVGRIRLRAEGDNDREEIAAVLANWYAAFGEEELTVADAVSRARHVDEVARLRRDDSMTPERVHAMNALGEILSTRYPPRPGQPCSAELVAVGRAFRGWKGRVVDGYVLERAGERNKIALWRVLRPDAGRRG